MKVLNDTELKALLTKLKSKFALANHTHTGYANSTHSHSVVSTTAAGFAPIRGNTTTKFLRDDGTWAVPPDTKVTVDANISANGTNPVQSKAIKTELDKKFDKSGGEISGDIDASGTISARELDIGNDYVLDKNGWSDDDYLLVSQGRNGLMLKEDKALVNHLGTDASGTFTVHDTEMWLGYVKDIAIENRAGAHFMSNGDSCIYIPRLRTFRFEVANVTIGEINSGGLHIVGKVTSTGSDYAKYYEWLDGNLENEDRRGLFVTLDGEKIKTANAEDDFILGVVSAAPGFVENACETEWQGKYLKDIYGERITQEVEVPESTDTEGNTIPAAIKTEYILNPKYNEDEKYIPRSQRSEWTYVGLTGELVVRDDGTCKVNGYCKPSEGGIATESERGYRVLARLDDTHIKVLIK